MRIFVCQYNPIVGDITNNVSKIIKAIKNGREHKADIILFPELAVCGYIPYDFLLYNNFIEEIEKQIPIIARASQDVTVILGLPRRNDSLQGKKLFNSTVIIENGKILGFQDKTLLPDYDVFNESRYFEPATQSPIWNIAGKKVGITICEDIWSNSTTETLHTHNDNPLEKLQRQQPDLLLNLSASPFHENKCHQRYNLFSAAARSLHCPVVSCNQIGANDGLIYDGNSMHVNAAGGLVHKAKAFQEDFWMADTDVTTSSAFKNYDATEEIYHALVLGIRDYCSKTNFSKACFGLSGGIDSAVVACLATAALGAENILSIGMPSRYSSEHSLTDSHVLAQNLGIKYDVISIEKPFKTFLDLLNPYFENKAPDITEENLQPRIRGMIIMAMSNKHGYLPLSTGNKSETAMGYATLYGDMCGGLNVIGDVYKTTVYSLAQWINRNGVIIPENTITKPPSAELKPNQKDSDSLPEYDIIDNVVTEYIEECHSPNEIAQKYQYPLEVVEQLIRKIHFNEYKRRQGAPCLRITKKTFIADRKLPIAHKWCL